MSHAVGAIIGVVEIVVGTLITIFSEGTLVELGNMIFMAGVAQLLGYAVSLFFNAHRTPLNPIGASYAGTLEPRRIIYGTLKVGGMYVTPPMTSGNNNDFIDIVFAVAGHQISGFGDFYLNQVRIANADIGAITGSTSDGVVSNNWTTNGYQGLVWIRRYNGSQTTPDYILNTTYTAWDNNHIGKGIAYWAVRCQYNQTAFFAGLPEFTGIVQGKAVYDPRLDSTNGGSGPQRYATPSTWTYSTNPALCLRDYLISSLGLGESNSRINDTLVAAAANICDQTVSVPAPIVPGLVNWFNGSTTVGGIGTNFLRDLNNGQFTGTAGNYTPTATIYLYAPNGSWYQVANVQSDTQLTLTAAYPGAAAYDQVVQWNTSMSTTASQARYTCNTVLDCTGRFEDNIACLARAMMGYCIYSGGQWQMYAGAWSGSAFALDETMLVSGVSVQCSTPRQNLWNAVRGNFVNPARGYNPDEFPPVLNSTYSTADGETIYTETNFPCCTNLFEAQRNALIVLTCSRDQKVVTAQFSMAAYGVKVFDTGTITIAEIGWINQTVRCINWKFMPKGTIELSLQEAYSTDWTTPVVGFYALKGANSRGALLAYIPYPPTGLTATSLPGMIQFNIVQPLQQIPGTIFQLYEYSAATPFINSTLVWTGSATIVHLPKTDTVTRYYWVRTVSPQSNASTTFPLTNGLAAAALLAQPWTPVINGSHMSITGNTITRDATSGWDSLIYASQGFKNGCSVAFTVTTSPSTTVAMAGLSVNPSAALGTTSYNEATYCIYCNSGGTLEVYNGGAGALYVSAANVWNAGDTFEVRYDGTRILYYHNGALFWSMYVAAAVAGVPLYPVALAESPGAVIDNFRFNAVTEQTAVTNMNFLPTSWVPGATGSQGNYLDQSAGTGGFTAGGVAIEAGPYGQSDIFWRGYGANTTGTAGGWTNGYGNAAANNYLKGDIAGIDPTKSYRFTMWVKWNGVSTGAPYFYAGWDTAGETLDVTTLTADANPYMVDGQCTNLVANRWYLVVGILHGHGYTGGHSGQSGIWDPILNTRLTSGFTGYVNGSSVGGGADFVLAAGALGQQVRILAPYMGATGGSNASAIDMVRPRFEQLNDSSPSIQSLLHQAAIDPTTAWLAAWGSTPSNFVGFVFTATTTTTSITVNWTSGTLYRPDGTTVAIGNGSQAITGLIASTTYYFFPYIADAQGGASAVSFVTGGSGSPTWAWSTDSPSAAQTMILRQNIPLNNFSVATPASGTGSGGGGGFHCPHPDTKIETLERGLINADELKVGEHLHGPNGAVRVRQILRRPVADWIVVRLKSMTGTQKVTVEQHHKFYNGAGEQVLACDLKPGMILQGGENTLLRVMGLMLLESPALAVSLELDDPHLYFMTRKGPLSHNLKMQ